MHEGSDQLLSEGSTEFSAHLATEIHKKTDIESTILCTDDNWFNRGVKEAIAIRKIKPTLNQFIHSLIHFTRVIVQPHRYMG